MLERQMVYCGQGEWVGVNQSGCFFVPLSLFPRAIEPCLDLLEQQCVALGLGRGENSQSQSQCSNTRRLSVGLPLARSSCLPYLNWQTASG